MNIKGLELPFELEADLKSGGRNLTERELSQLIELLKQVESPLPKFYAREQIVSQHQLWESASANDYLGAISNAVSPGDVDPKLTLIIGEAEPDSPIALDYRTSPARVIYFGDVNCDCHWIELSPDYGSLIQSLQKAAT